MILKDYQKEAVRFLIKKKRAILIMGCGMGKTITSLYACFDKGIVVVAPPSLRSKWLSEAKICGREIEFISCFNKNDMINTKRSKFLIIDEAHDYLKDWNRNKELILLAKRCAYVYMLTATPLINDPLPLYWMLKICGERFSKKEFLLVFCGGKHLQSNPKIIYKTKPTNLKLLKKIKEKHSFEKDRDLNIRKFYARMGKAPIGTSKDLENYSNIENILGILKTKDEKILKILKKCLQSSKKSVIFFSHNAVGRFLHRRFGGLIIDGSVSHKKREHIFSAFKNGNLFLNSRTVGVGVDIEEVEKVVFFERTWSPFRDYQAYMRCYRIKRKEVLKVYFLDYEDEAKLLVGNKKNILKEV